MARYLAKGTQLQMGNGLSPETFTAVAQAKTIDGPAMSRTDVDLSDHDASAKIIISEPLYDPGSIDFELNFDPNNTTHAALLTAFQANTQHNWELHLPTTPAKKFTFAGFVNKFGPKAPFDGPLTMAGAVRITGPTTLV